MIDIRKVEGLEVDGVDSRDYPSFCDAYFSYGIWIETGIELTEDELDELGETYADYLNEMAYESLL